MTLYRFFLLTRRLFFFTLAVTALLFSAFYFMSWWEMSHDASSEIEMLRGQVRCEHYGKNLSVEEYFKPYTVKPGDTLLTIAQQEMGDSAKAELLILANRKKYPQLSMERPQSLEVGMELQIPHPDFGPIHKKLTRESGLIMSTSGDRIDLINQRDMISMHGFPLDQDTPLIGTNVLKKGDCINVFFDGDSGEVVAVELQ